MMLSKSLATMLLFLTATAAVSSANAATDPSEMIYDTVDHGSDTIVGDNGIGAADHAADDSSARLLTGRREVVRTRRSRATKYSLNITNLSFQQPFGRFFVMVHSRNAAPLFKLGKSSSDGLRDLAENGNPDTLVKQFKGNKEVGYVGTAAGVAAGAEMSITIPVTRKYQYVTIASMCLNTNDCFVALNGQRVKIGAVNSPGYDSGTERNNESCSSVPGPACPMDSGNVASGGGEGFVHIHRGFFGISNDPEDIRLSEPGYDWRNPMMLVEMSRA